MKLVERQDISYLETFDSANPDVAEVEMKLSESDSKFVHGWGWRSTFMPSQSKKNLHKSFRTLK